MTRVLFIMVFVGEGGEMYGCVDDNNKTSHIKDLSSDVFYCEDSNGIYKRTVYGGDEGRCVLVAVLHGRRMFTVDDVHVDTSRCCHCGHTRVVTRIGGYGIGDP